MIVLAVATMALVSLPGCGYFLWLQAEYAAMDARAVAACAQQRAGGSPAATAANAAAAGANQHAAEALQTDNLDTAFVAAMNAGEDADEVFREAEKVGCNPTAILAQKRLDGSYDQDIFGSQRRGPHT